MKRIRPLLLLLVLLFGTPLVCVWIISLNHRPSFEREKVHPAALEMGRASTSIAGHTIGPGETIIVSTRESGVRSSIRFHSAGKMSVKWYDEGGWYDQGVRIDELQYPDTRAFLYCLLEDCRSRDLGIQKAQRAVFERPSLAIQMKLFLRGVLGYYRDETSGAEQGVDAQAAADVDSKGK